jgi:hypothetical protein
LRIDEEEKDQNMKHKQFHEWLQLSLYDELNDQEVRLLQDHLTTCEECRNDLDELKRLHRTLAQRQLAVAQEPLLQDARRSLRVRIRTEAEKESLWTILKGALDYVMAPRLQVVLGGIAIMVIGILTGYVLFKSPAGGSSFFQSTASTSSAMEAGESQITNIRFINREPQTGNVEFMFETITPVRVNGNINDERVQKVLARALVSDQNAGTRLRAVSMIGTSSEQKQTTAPKLDPEVRTALITALLHDRNLGVQKEALNVLKNYLPDPVIVRAFLDVLAKEKNTSLKITAINSLDLAKYENQPVNREILEMFRQKAQSDDNNYIRIKAKTALQEARQ